MKYVLLLPFIILLFSCSNDDNSPESIEPPSASKYAFLRVENASSFDYDDVYINTGGGDYFYGSILSGIKTAYIPFDSLYDYAFVELLIEGDTFTIQPIDYVGEIANTKGYFTYQIIALDSGNRYSRIGINFKIDTLK